MQAVLLAGGQSSRMYPFSQNGHKSMLRILDKPIIQHVIEKLNSKNISEIIIVTNDPSLKDSFNNLNIGAEIKYVIQNEPSGMGDALLLCKEYVHRDFILVNAYHLDIDLNLDELIKLKNNNDGVLLLNKREETWRYGVVEIEGEKITRVIEKPDRGKEPSNFCLVGCYILSSKFLNVLEKVTSHQYSLEDALDIFVKNNSVGYIISENSLALKYPWDLLKIKNYLLSNISSYRGENIKIGKNVILEGEIYIGKNVVIMDGACIKGPCYLGDNAYVGSNALLRDGVILEEGSSVGSFSEVKNTLIMRNSKMHSGFMGDSIVGADVKIGGMISTTNVRLDRKNISVLVKSEKVDTGFRHFGAVIGNNVNIGGSVTIMPGIIIGNSSIIGPSTTVMTNVEDNTKYYTEFKEIVVKK